MDSITSASLSGCDLYLRRYPEIDRSAVLFAFGSRLYRQTNHCVRYWLSAAQLPDYCCRSTRQPLWLYGSLWRDRYRPRYARWTPVAPGSLFRHVDQPDVFPLSNVARVPLFLWCRYRFRLLLDYHLARRANEYRIAIA